MQNKDKAALALTSFFLLMAWNGTWFEISASGTYTEGLEREPTISTEYTIDSEQESFEMSIENATPLLLYWVERVDVTANDEDWQSGSSGGNDESSNSEESQSSGCHGSCLDQSRSIVQLAMISLIVALYLSSIRPSWKLKTGLVVVWLIGSVVIVTAVPIAVAYDFGVTGDGGEGESSSTGGFDTATQQNSVGVDQFAHYQESGDVNVQISGISFYFDSVGFDLGLLEEEERQAVIDQPPSPGEPAYDSLVRFHGELNVGPGEILSWWLLTSPVLVLSILGISSKKLEEE